LAFCEAFYTINQYRFQSELCFKDGQFKFKTYLTSSVKVDFVKFCLFAKIIESECYSEVPEIITKVNVPRMKDVVSRYEGLVKERTEAVQNEAYSELSKTVS